MPLPQTKKDAQLTLRLEGTMKKDLRAAARRRDRSLNWLAELIFKQWLVKERRRHSR